MGREVKRVPLDFDWPLHKVWEGYLNPHYDACEDCIHCGGNGYSTAARYFLDQWYGNERFDPERYGVPPLRLDDPDLAAAVRRKVERDERDGTRRYTARGTLTLEAAVQRETYRMWTIHSNQWMHHLNQADVDALAAAERLVEFTHTWDREAGWTPKDPPVRPTAAEVNRWALVAPPGHDSINAGVCIRARCEREGVRLHCRWCHGHGSLWESAEVHQQAEQWCSTEPPTGPAYQLWETITEGSPVSPPFERPEELARWLVAHPPTEGERVISYEQWLAFLTGPGWAPSFVSHGPDLLEGVAAMVDGV